MSDAQTTASVSRTPSLAELLERHFEYQARKINVALPGKIRSYDATKQIAEVEPLVKELYPTRSGREVLETLPVLPNVPVVFPRGGGHFITFPLAEGDFVLLVFNQRSIDRWYRGDGKPKNPDDFRTHDLSDAVAIPGFYPYDQPVGEDDIDANLVIGKDGGSTIHIREDGEIHLAENNAAQYVALAQKVLDELEAVKADLDGFKTAYDEHIHTTTATVGTGSVGTISPTTSTAPAPHTPASVAAEKVKAT